MRIPKHLIKVDGLCAARFGTFGWHRAVIVDTRALEKKNLVKVYIRMSQSQIPTIQVSQKESNADGAIFF